ncbi:hypothetical protein BLA29_005678 [Euroglyphus maynei]|uniref:Uncharacterized protein n=1 Tax=Euroglyphus maynei TaxID=6958 RepID=A0A1Y3BBY3_EURMA|nr:hypothetical protein BLA29_005678 [Euroglyphus maynei]
MAKKAKLTKSNQWMQYEFTKPIYMTGFSFTQARGSSIDPFIVRVQNEPIGNRKSDEDNDDDGTICYSHDVSIIGQPQLTQKSDRKWIRCQVIISSFEYKI